MKVTKSCNATAAFIVLFVSRTVGYFMADLVYCPCNLRTTVLSHSVVLGCEFGTSDFNVCLLKGQRTIGYLTL